MIYATIQLQLIVKFFLETSILKKESTLTCGLITLKESMFSLAMLLLWKKWDTGQLCRIPTETSLSLTPNNIILSSSPNQALNGVTMLWILQSSITNLILVVLNLQSSTESHALLIMLNIANLWHHYSFRKQETLGQKLFTMGNLALFKCLTALIVIKILIILNVKRLTVNQLQMHHSAES